ncbi:MAG: cadmium-translocating P-type ATPase, partial [Clostridia bacterium]|nr:cadmium-translocating P-type ATPase [Clostridia bacterium]
NFLVKPGERIALDGIVVEGSCTIDTSTITGESVPVFVQKGDKVISGCICLDGTLTVQSTSDYDNCTVAQILDMVENATFNKAPAEKFITKFSRYYTPVVVILAVLIAIVPPLFLQNWAVWIKRAMMFLFVSCPCALVISIPLGFFGGIAACSKKGILIKGSNYLEMLSKINLFAFDKTGTLTKGKFDIVNVYPQENKQQVLKLAAIAEQYSTHPIAQCILASTAPQCSATVQEIAGKGIVAKTADSTILCGNASLMTENQVEFEQSSSKTVVYVAENGKFVGYVELADQLKEDSITAIAKLHKMGANTAMLTGDNDHIAKEIATQLGIGKTYSQLLPQEKATIVQNLKTQGNKVAFVGDGINDAPVLATADVGIAMGAMGSDIAIQTADIVLMQDNPTALSTAVNISKKTLKVVKQNIVISLVIKFAVLILSAIGLLDTIAFGLVIAILADVGVCVVAILNSMRTMLPPRK